MKNFKQKKTILLLGLVILLLGNKVNAQYFIQGNIQDSEDKRALPFANVTLVGKNQGTISDLEGNFSLQVSVLPATIKVSYIGYKSQEIAINKQGEKTIVALEMSASSLSDVTIFAGENPALRLIRGVMDNRAKNDHENLASYTCRSYNRMRIGPVFTFSDSVLPPQEVWTNEFKQLKSNDFFLSESVGTRTYRRPGKAIEDIEATRTSGLKQPLFAIFATQLQSFTFYEPSFTLLDLEYLSPFNKHLERYYKYRITDTMVVDNGRDTIYTVQFEPQPDRKFQSMYGRIQIQAPDMAIRSVFAQPTKIPDQNFEVEIRQLYEKTSVWFPTQLHADIRFNQNEIAKGKVDTAGTVKFTAHLNGEIRSHFSDLQVQEEKRFKVPTGIAARIQSDAADKDEQFWLSQRAIELSERDLATYKLIDSLGEKYNFDRMINIVQTISDAYVRLGKFDLDLNKLMRFNRHENIYLGVGGITNDLFSKRIQLNGFGGYGFGDNRWKYGYGSQIKITNNLWVSGGYFFDLQESGGNNFGIRSRGTLLENTRNLRRFNISVYDELSAAFFQVEWHPIATWQNKLRIQRENRFIVGSEYGFYHPDITGNQWQNGFTYTMIQYEGRWAPNEQFIENRGRRQLVEPAYPIFRYSIEKNIPSLSVDEGDFWRAESQLDFSWKNPYRGVLHVRLQGGHTQGISAYSYLYSPLSNLHVNQNAWIKQSTLGDAMAFETVGFNELLYQSYAATIAHWNIRQLLFKRNNKFPELAFSAKFMYGEAPATGEHLGLTFHSGAVSEFGVEFLKLFGGIGVGIYHRPDDRAIFPWVFKLRI